MIFCFLPQKEEKSPQHKVWNGDLIPVQTPPPPKPTSPTALEPSAASLATVSNIDIDIQPQQDEDLIKEQMQGPQSAVSINQAVNEPVTHSKGRGKPDACSPPSPVKPPRKSVSGVVSRGGDEGRPSDGSLNIPPQNIPSPRDTFAVCRVKRTTDVEDTMELLKEADVQVFELELEKKSEHKPDIENVEVRVEVNGDERYDTVTLLKGAPTQHCTSEIQVIIPR